MSETYNYSNSARVIIAFMKLLKIEPTITQYGKIIESLSTITEDRLMSDHQIINIATSMILDDKTRDSILVSLGISVVDLAKIALETEPIKVMIKEMYQKIVGSNEETSDASQG